MNIGMYVYTCIYIHIRIYVYIYTDVSQDFGTEHFWWETYPSHTEWIMAHMNESWHIWMSHVAYEWVMAHIFEITDITIPHWMSHVAYEWVMSHMNESCHIVAY